MNPGGQENCAARGRKYTSAYRTDITTFPFIPAEQKHFYNKKQEKRNFRGKKLKNP